MKFTKMQGAGNDYVYLDCTRERVPGDMSALARKISDRHFGVGSDGLILICPSETADFRMEMYNADGSQGRMCGNGVRCVGKYVFDRGLTDKTKFTVETLAGIRHLEVFPKDGKAEKIRVDMGIPEFAPEKIPARFEGERVLEVPLNLGELELKLSCVSMGNPHAVTFVADADNYPVETVGRLVENSNVFPEGVNTEFVQILSRDRMKMRVWERGSGETLACGTGACASLVAAALSGRCDRAATVELLGGELFIEWDENGTVWMTGEAAFIFDGEYHLDTEAKGDSK